MKRVWALISLAACGCGDPVVSLRVDAARFPELQVNLRIVSSPEMPLINCDAVAFGDIAIDDLGPFLERQERASEDHLSFADLPQGAPKLIIAEGLRSDGARRAAGCVEAPRSIETDLALSLALEPLSNAAIEPGANATGTIETGLDVPIHVQVVDLDGRALSAVPVRWQLLLALGQQIGGEAISAADGGAMIDPPLPPVIGPVALITRARWSVARPPPISGFVRPLEVVENLVPGELAIAKIGERGELRVARRTGSRIERCSDPTLSSCTLLSAGAPASSGRLLTLEGAEVDGADRLLVAASDGWAVIDRSGAVAPWSSAPSIPDRALTGGSCPAPNVLLIPSDGGATAVLQQGGAVDIFPGLQLLSSGCVSSNDGRLLRTAILFDPLSRAAFVAPDLLPGAPWPGPPGAFSFGLDHKSGERVLLGPQLVLTTIAIARARWRVEADAGLIEVLGFDQVPGRPQQVRLADVDGDGDSDRVTILEPATAQGCGEGCSLWIILDGDPVIAGGLSLRGVSNPSLITGDLDGDGADEVVILDAIPAPTWRVIKIGPR